MNIDFQLKQGIITEIPDNQLLKLCKKFGAQTLAWKRKFIGLLPEVNRRRLYEKSGNRGSHPENKILENSENGLKYKSRQNRGNNDSEGRKGRFGSIFEFAAKFAGISREQVCNVINLDREFFDKPLLRKMLVNGEVSINKLIRITSVVKKENEEFWAMQVRLLSKSALETLVRDEKILRAEASARMENESRTVGIYTDKPDEFVRLNGSQEPLKEASQLPGQLALQMDGLANFSSREFDKSIFSSHSRIEPQLSNEPQQLDPSQTDISCMDPSKHCNLTEHCNTSKLCGASEAREAQPQANPLKLLQLKLSEEMVNKLLEIQKKGIDLNETLLELLENREEEIKAEKQQLSEAALREAVLSSKQLSTLSKSINPSRYIKVAIRNLLQKENGTKCTIPTCNKLSKPIHHTQRFALSQIHDPYFLAKLCSDHHQIAHSIDLKVQEKRKFG